MMYEIMLIKLVTGEDIIAGYEESDNNVTCNDPFSLAMHPEKGLVLMKFSPYALTDKVVFDKRHVLAVLPPQPNLESHYKEITSKIITPKQGIIV